MSNQKYSVAFIESQGVACKFFSMGGLRDGWIMPDGVGVDYAGYGQLRFEPATISTANIEGLRRAREAVANMSYLGFDFGYLITDANAWSDTDSDDWTKVCYGEDGDERARLVLHVRFKQGCAEPDEVYALDLSTGNSIGGPAE